MLKKLACLFALLLAACFIYIVLNIDDISKKYFYPVNYEEYVEKYSDRENMDKYLIYAIIKTESGFDKDAESEAGARGLMQIMDDAFEWVKFRMGDKREITYEDMYNAEHNIEYGIYLIRILYNEYGDEATALAAYHTGRGNVNSWLEDERYSSDGKTLAEIPSGTTEHYVNKVMSAYRGYTNLYTKK